MGEWDIADELLSGNIEQPKQSGEWDVAEELISGGGVINQTAQQDYQPPKPQPQVGLEYLGRRPSMLASLKSGFVDDPTAKAMVLARDLFPGTPDSELKNRVLSLDTGGMAFQDDSGQWKRIDPYNFLGGASASAAHTPSIVLGTAGAAIGGPFAPLTAGIGAMGGEGYRKAIGSMLGDKQTVSGNVADMAIEGAFGAGGELAGSLVGKAFRSVFSPGKATKLTGRIVRDGIDDIDYKLADELGKISRKQWGMELSVAELSENQTLINTLNYLADHPATAKKMREYRQYRSDQTQEKIGEFIQKVFPGSKNRLQTGRQVTRAADDVMKGYDAARKAASDPLYKKALKSNPMVDISKTLDMIDKNRKLYGGDVYKSIAKAKEIITRGTSVGKKAQGITEVAGFGKPIARLGNSKKEIPLVRLDGAKKELDDAIGYAVDHGDREVAMRLTQIKNSLLEEMDAVSPKYAEARKAFEKKSRALDAMDKTYIGRISKAEKDRDLARIATDLFRDDPAIIRKSIRKIEAVDPGARKAMLRTHFQNILDNVKESAVGDVPNIGGNFYKKAFGSPMERARIRSAVTQEEYNSIKEFMDLARRTGHIFKRESTTAARQETNKIINRATGNRLAGVVENFDLSNPFMRSAKKFNDAIRSSNSKDLAEFLTSEEAAKGLQRIKKVSQPSKQLEMFATLVTLGVRGVAREREALKEMEGETGTLGPVAK